MLSIERVPLVGYGVAVLATLLTLLLRVLLVPILNGNAPLLVFILPVMISAWYGGLRPGLLATGLSALVGVYFFISPVFDLHIPDLSNGTRVAIFVIEGVMISWLCQALHTAKQRAERSTRSLQASEEQYRLLVTSVRDYAIYGLDPYGHVTSWNSGAELIKGYRAAEVLGRPVSIFYTDEQIAHGLPDHDLHMAAIEGRYEDTGWRKRKDGSLFWAHMIVTALRDANGNLYGFSSMTRDITEQRRNQQALQESYALLNTEKTTSDLERKRLRTILDILPVGVLIVDAAGKVLQMNAAMRGIWGQEAPLVEDVQQYSQYRGWRSRSQEPIAAEGWAAARALQQGETVINEEITIETFDGHRKTLLNSAVPICDETNTVVNVVVVNVDITQRQQAEEGLRRSIQRLEVVHDIDRAILNSESSATIAHAVLSRLINITPADQAAVLLYNFTANKLYILAGEIGGDKAGQVVPMSDRLPPEILKYRERVWYVEDMADLLQLPVGLERLLTDGYHSFLAVALQVDSHFLGDLVLFARATDAFSPIDRDIAQEVASQLSIAIQQSQLRQQLQHYTEELEQRVAERTAALQEANEGLEAFSYSASHDLRAPLRSMQGLAQALLEDYGDRLDATGRVYAQEIATSAQQADQLIFDLLGYARLSRSDITVQPLNLTAIVAEVVAEVQEDLPTQSAQITVDTPLPEVMGHRPTLIQAILNLVTNAIKFVPIDRSPQVHIWAEVREPAENSQPKAAPNAAASSLPPSSWVRLWIEDHGIGIAPEHQEQIFQAFERLHTVEEYPGTGIGLAIVRKGIERMGGRVGVESVLGQGSRFWVDLPIGIPE